MSEAVDWDSDNFCPYRSFLTRVLVHRFLFKGKLQGSNKRSDHIYKKYLDLVLAFCCALKKRTARCYSREMHRFPLIVRHALLALVDIPLI